MSEVSEGRKLLLNLVLDMSEELIPQTMEYIMREKIGYDEEEPPLTEEELTEIAIAEQEIAENKGIPLPELLKGFNK